jgi:hypothetical protein
LNDRRPQHFCQSGQATNDNIAVIQPFSDTLPMTLHKATLTLGSGRTIEVPDQLRLSSLLAGLDTLQDGQVVVLERGQSDFIKATRQGAHWSVTAKRGKMWTAQSFTAEMTTGYSERRTRESRTYKFFFERLLWWLCSPPPERALSTKQVRTLFVEYLCGEKFTLPISGA